MSIVPGYEHHTRLLVTGYVTGYVITGYSVTGYDIQKTG